MRVIAVPNDELDQPEGESVAPLGALYQRLNVLQAWNLTRGDPSTLVGVIDQGFDFFHPLLKLNLSPGYYHDGGFHTEFFENIAHGTSVAGLIVACKDDATGLEGLAPRCRAVTASLGLIEHTLIKLRQACLEKHPTASLAELQQELAKHQEELSHFGREWVEYTVSGVASGIRYLVDRGVTVINISGYLQRDLCRSAEGWQNLERAFTLAASRGVVIVLGAGNGGVQTEGYPGNPATVIVAGATRLDDTRWQEETLLHGVAVKQGSNYGRRLTVMAPVENLLVCMPHDPRVYATLDGPMGPTKVEFTGPHQLIPIGATSCAAPIVTALVALVRCVRPDLGASSVVEIIKQGCDPLASGGFDIYTGYGRVNFGKTVVLARDWRATAEPVAAADGGRDAGS